jgi:hypothetical protein
MVSVDEAVLDVEDARRRLYNVKFVPTLILFTMLIRRRNAILSTMDLRSMVDPSIPCTS